MVFDRLVYVIYLEFERNSFIGRHGFEAAPRPFSDSKVLLSLIADDAGKAAKAEAILRARCLVGVQVLDEMTNIMRRKYQYPWPQIERVLHLVRSQCPVEPLTLETHDIGRRLAERHPLQSYGSLIAASALLAGCETLYSEAMRHGLLLEGRLRVVDPFS